MASSSPSPSGGFVPDLATCRLMAVNEKIALVRGLSKFHLSAPEELQEWSRREIIEVLCAELGKEQKERTFSSMPKHKLLDFLFKVVSGESSYPRKHKETKSIPDPKSINEKRELVRGLSNYHRSAPEQLQEWSRREILEVLCAELGKEQKERTFSSMPKNKLLDFLFKVVSGESSYPRKHKETKSIPEPKSINEKRELVRGLSNYHRSEQLQAWSRREILEVLCAELGKERKERTFSSMSKHKLLDFLFKVVNGESFHPLKHKKRKSVPEPNAVNIPPTSKRQRKNHSAALLPVRAATSLSAPRNNAHLCHNSACTATRNPEDKFCKCCSCCICFKYDDYKDPTLWLFCNSDQSLQEDSCGFSCHLECALEDERSGILQSGQSKKLDGDYYCIQCGKQNDLLGCWRKQLWVAKDARRLDVLCHRIFLCHKILISTKRYLVLHEIVEQAMKKLEDELGPITGTLDVGHGLVCRLAVGAEVQKLCIFAIESFESLFSSSLTADLRIQRSCITHCEPTSKLQNIKHGGTGEVDDLEKFPGAAAAVFDGKEEIPRSDAQAALLRKSSSLMAYNRVTLKQNLETIFFESETATLANTGNMLVAPPECSDSLLRIRGRGTIKLKGVAEKNFEEAISGHHVSQNGCLKTEMDQESLSCKTSLGGFDDREDKDGSLRRDTTAPTSLPRESPDLIHNNSGALHKLNADASRMKNAPGVLAEIGNRITFGNEIGATSFKSENDYRIPQPSKPETEPGSSSNKNLSGKHDETSCEDGCSEASYEYCVKMIRRLECEGYICADFRLNFLTWFCLRATRQDRRVVSVFMDTLIDDPASLASQLRDTFSDAIRRKRQPRGPFVFGVELRP